MFQAFTNKFSEHYRTMQSLYKYLYISIPTYHIQTKKEATA